MRYELTDGHEVHDIREMTEQEAQEANERAKEYTDGNLYWRRSPDVKVIRRTSSAEKAYYRDDPTF